MLFPLIFFCIIPIFHPLHLAVTEVEYKADTRTLQITHKIFTDDLEKQLEKELRESGRAIRLQLGTPKEYSQTDALLKSYLETHFILKINGKVVATKLLGKEQETDATWIYMETTDLKTPKKFEVSDTILLELYDDQQNFVHLKVGDKKKSLRFRKAQIKESWEP